MSPLEIAANALATVSILLAARNHVATWPAGIVGCALFIGVFVEARLYADASLQLFFIATSVYGWLQWRAGAHPPRAIGSTGRVTLLGLLALAAMVTLGYGGLLHHFTDAWMPYLDSAVMALSVVAQGLLMLRKIENWPLWLVVNTLSVPLFASRGLHLTAALYAVYWFNAWYGWWHWRRQLQAQQAARAS